MEKIISLLLFVGDVVSSLVLYPIIYIGDMVYLLYACIRYDYNFGEGFIGINKKYIYYIVNGLKIHKERILGS